MADTLLNPKTTSRISWPAIFAGTFVFLAIEVTFGVLGMAIFASAANPSSAHPVAGMSAGIGIWLVILSIIALYCAGRAAAMLSGSASSHLGMYHGLTTFGLSVFTSIVVGALLLGSTTVAAADTGAAAGPATVASVVATAGYWLFAALVLGMIAAGMGGSHGVSKTMIVQAEEAETPGIRRVA
jgi:hypothetical protein